MEPTKTYHLYTHANGFENLFRSKENYRYFLRRYEYFISPIADTLAWCLMPNHIHFLIRVKNEREIIEAFPETDQTSEGSQTSEVLRNLPQTSEVFRNLGGLRRGLTIEKRIPKQFGNLFNSYTKAFNKMYDRKGSLFIPNFKRKEISNDRYFTTIIHYIHANPVHHGFLKTIDDWPWSSFHELLTGERTFLKGDEVIEWFGNKEEFIKYHQQPIEVRTQAEFDIF